MKLKKVLAGVLASAMALTTMAVTSYAGELSWTNSNGVYTYTTEADPDTSDENYNGTAEYLMGVKLDAYLPSGATMADVRKINVTVSVTGGNCGGTIGCNTIVGDNPWSWTQVEYTTGKTATIDAPNGIADGTELQVGVDWANYNTTITAEIELEVEVEEEAPPVDEPIEEEPVVPSSTVIWEGSTDMGTNWGSTVSASNITANEDDKLVVSYTIGTAEYQQIKIMDGSWTPITAPVTNDYDCVELAAGTSSYEVILNAADAAALTSGGILISGYNVTVTKIELISASSGESDSDNPGEIAPEAPKPEESAVIVIPNVTPVITVSAVPANSAKKFEITDSVTGKTISTSVNKLAKALSKLTEGSELAFDTGDFGMVLRKNVIKEIVDNDLTLTIKTSKATFIIDADNLAKVKTINIPAIMKTAEFKKLLKEGNTFNVIVTEKNKVEIELA